MEEFAALPEAVLDNPFRSAALTVVALCIYAADQEIGSEVLSFLRGARVLTEYEQQFLSERLSGKHYIPFSFFAASVPGNNYSPAMPYCITVEARSHSFDQDGRVTLFIHSGGADAARPVTLRAEENKWYLSDQLLLADIQKPYKEDLWR